MYIYIRDITMYIFIDSIEDNVYKVRKLVVDHHENEF